MVSSFPFQINYTVYSLFENAYFLMLVFLTSLCFFESGDDGLSTSSEVDQESSLSLQVPVGPGTELSTVERSLFCGFSGIVNLCL